MYGAESSSASASSSPLLVPSMEDACCSRRSPRDADSAGIWPAEANQDGRGRGRRSLKGRWISETKTVARLTGGVPGLGSSMENPATVAGGIAGGNLSRSPTNYREM